MIKKITTFVVAMLILTSAHAQTTGSYETTLKKYFEVSGSMQAFKSAISSIMANYKNMRTDIPVEFWNELETELGTTSMGDLVKMMEPIYQKHLTEDELKAIIAFYATPAGKKLAEKTPVIMQESMQAGQQWGMAIGSKVAQKMKDKGY